MQVDMAAALRLCGGTTASSSGPALPELTPFAIQASPPPPSKSAPIAAATTMAPQLRPAAAMTPWASSMAFASAIASHLFAPFRKVQPPLAPMPMGHRRVVWQVDERQQQPATQSMSALHSDAAAAFPRQATAPRELLQQTAIRPTFLNSRRQRRRRCRRPLHRCCFARHASLRHQSSRRCSRRHSWRHRPLTCRRWRLHQSRSSLR